MPDKIKKILVVDDEKNIQVSLASVLEDEGYTVYLASSGEEAVEKFKQTVNGLPEVAETYYVSGNTDFLLKVYTCDMDGYHRFITQHFANIENVHRFYSTFVMETSKQETAFVF